MIKAKVKNIRACKNLHLVDFDFNGQSLTMMSLELDSYIKQGVDVLLNIKPSHVALGIKLELTSHSNVIYSRIRNIEKGKLVSYVSLELSDGSNLDAIITSKSLNKLNLKEGKEVYALVKASEISIAKVLS